MGEGDEDVGEDDGGVGVDRRRTMMALAAFRRHQERGGRAPFFFLDLLPRWEKGSHFGPWPPWRRRGESPSEIGYVSLSLSVFAFQIPPFHRFLYSRRSITPIGLNFGHNFYPDIRFLAAK